MKVLVNGQIMPSLKRNYRQVELAKALGGKRTRYTIEGMRGLVLDISPSGSRTWILRYQVGRGSARRFRYYHIGDATKVGLAQAVDRAKEITAAVELEGRDPVVERASPKEQLLTVSDLVEQFLARHVRAKLKPSSIQQYEYRLRAFVLPEIGELPAAEVRKRDIIELADNIAEEGKREKKSSGRGSKGGLRAGGAPRLADGVIEIVASMYSWAQKRDMLETNPAFRVAKYSERPRRNRVLADHEFPIFWAGTEQPNIGSQITMILRLLLLTGQRRAEVAGARVQEFHLQSTNPRWIIGSERTKNGIAHTLPLAPTAARYWAQALTTFSDGEYVFPASRTGVSSHVHPAAVSRAMRMVRHRLSLDDLTVHDLRRTVRTRMAALKIPREISARVLNHVDEYERGVHDESYNRHEYFEEKLEAISKWENWLVEATAKASRHD